MAKTPLIAVIQFPGVNTEYETRREIDAAGMKGEFFRWNEEAKRLSKFDGFILPGGFSYEDRGRAGLVAALEPIMGAIREQSEKGKPVLGICNGAQMAMETGMVPGAENYKLAMALARNRRIKDNQVLGTGYYNDWIYIKHTASKGRTAFTINIEDGEVLYMPVAHGEGRFVTAVEGLLDQLIHNQQTVFRYCDKSGSINNEFPVNPNGSLYNLAAVCNPDGNVMSIMPHHERSLVSEKFFTSMRDYILGAKLNRPKISRLKVSPPDPMLKEPYSPPSGAMQFFVDLVITDNEADTIEHAVCKLGLSNVRLARRTHFEIGLQDKVDSKALAKKIIQSGLLLNTNKEAVTMKAGRETLRFKKESGTWIPLEKASNSGVSYDFSLLAREKQDLFGLAKTNTAHGRLKMDGVTHIKRGIIWNISVDSKSQKEKERVFKKLMSYNVFTNPHYGHVQTIGS